MATVYDEPPYGSTPDQNRKFYADKGADAGKLGVDLLCLGEGVTLVSTAKNLADVAEPVPGPTSRVPSARKNSLTRLLDDWHTERVIERAQLLAETIPTRGGQLERVLVPAGMGALAMLVTFTLD